MPSGLVEFDERGTACFRPHVPRAPALDDVHDLLDPATDALRTFDRRLQEWPDPHVVGRLFARLDAVSSAGAEGSTTTFTDLLEYESSLRTARDPVDAAAVAALSDATDEVAGAGLMGMVLDLHRRLFERAEARHAAQAGRLKVRVNRTVDPDSAGGLFAYTLPTSVPSAMGEWEAYVMADALGVPDLVRQCLGHWMFEHIHPVHDGNGRIGRLLIPLVLRRKGLTRSASAFVSEGVYHDKELYIASLKYARTSNDMLGWTRLMLGFVEQGARANVARLVALLEIKGKWEREIRRYRSDSVVHSLLPFALTRPAFTISDAARATRATFASVNNAAAKLTELGLLTIAEGARRDRLFQTEEVLRLFDHFRTPAPEPEAAEPGPPQP